MGSLVRPTPILRVSRKELELVVRILTDDDTPFLEGVAKIIHEARP